VADIASGLWDVLSDIGGAIGDVLGGAADVIGGGLSSLTSSIDISGMLSAAQPTALASPPSGDGAASSMLGALAPGAPLAAVAPAGATTVDQSVDAGGITVNVSAERLEADSASLLSDDIVAQLQRRLGSLRSEQDFREGARPTA
jgi:hypothetical protein